MGALLNTMVTQSGGLLLGWILAAGCAVGYGYLIFLHYPALSAAPLLGPTVLAAIRAMLSGLGDEKSAPPEAADDEKKAPSKDKQTEGPDLFGKG
jgi:hypothetical protein